MSMIEPGCGCNGTEYGVRNTSSSHTSPIREVLDAPGSDPAKPLWRFAASASRRTLSQTAFCWLSASSSPTSKPIAQSFSISSIITTPFSAPRAAACPYVHFINDSEGRKGEDKRSRYQQQSCQIAHHVRSRLRQATRRPLRRSTWASSSMSILSRSQKPRWFSMRWSRSAETIARMSTRRSM